ncbi:MAG: hypothetical protein V7K25_25685 [Nostoc sp.]|uniref:hypothetical protein n=1 Tax=Nostoc sp. TaxID=1180 RepID=UPI002FF610AF
MTETTPQGCIGIVSAAFKIILCTSDRSGKPVNISDFSRYLENLSLNLSPQRKRAIEVIPILYEDEHN